MNTYELRANMLLIWIPWGEAISFDFWKTEMEAKKPRWFCGKIRGRRIAKNRDGSEKTEMVPADQTRLKPEKPRWMRENRDGRGIAAFRQNDIALSSYVFTVFIFKNCPGQKNQKMPWAIFPHTSVLQFLHAMNRSVYGPIVTSMTIVTLTNHPSNVKIAQHQKIKKCHGQFVHKFFRAIFNIKHSN